MILTHFEHYPVIGRSIASDKHIAIITPGFAANEQDTTCITALWIFVRELHLRGIAVTIFALHYLYIDKSYLCEEFPIMPLKERNRFWKRKPFFSIGGNYRNS